MRKHVVGRGQVARARRRRGDQVGEARRRRQARDEEQRAEERAVPQRPGAEGREQDAGVDAEGDADHMFATPISARLRAATAGRSRLERRPAVAQRPPAGAAGVSRRAPDRRAAGSSAPQDIGDVGWNVSVHAPHVQLVLEVEEQREHAEAEQHQAQPRQHGQHGATGVAPRREDSRRAPSSGDPVRRGTGRRGSARPRRGARDRPAGCERVVIELEHVASSLQVEDARLGARPPA